MKTIIKLKKFQILQYSIGIFFLLLLTASEAVGQSITIGGGNQTLTITSGIAGNQDLNDVINTNCTLNYSTPLFPNVRYKITVRTSCPGQSFNLSVVATGVTQGTAQATVVLSNGASAVDFIRDIRRNRSGTCSLNYTAGATFAMGNSDDEGNDVHTVTYTIQQQ